MNNRFDFSEDQKDALVEILNMGVGGAADVLNRMVEKHINLTIPSLCIASGKVLSGELKWDDVELALVNLDFSGGLNGTGALLMTRKDAISLAGFLQDEELGDDSPLSEWSETVDEVGNIIVNSVLGQVANSFGHNLDYTVPRCSHGKMDDVTQNWISEDSLAIVAEALIEVKEAPILAKILTIFSTGSLEQLAEDLDKALLKSA